MAPWKYNLKIKDLFEGKKPQTIEDVLQIIKYVDTRLSVFLDNNKTLDDGNFDLEDVVDFFSNAKHEWFSSTYDAVESFDDTLNTLYDWADAYRVLIK